VKAWMFLVVVVLAPAASAECVVVPDLGGDQGHSGLQPVDSCGITGNGTVCINGTAPPLPAGLEELEPVYNRGGEVCVG